MSGSAPAAPDYTSAAVAQGQQSQQLAAQQTAANRPNINTPWGGISWDTSQGTDAATGTPTTLWSGNVNLTPSEQAALTSQQTEQANRSNAANTLWGASGSTLSTAPDFSGVQKVQGGQYNDAAAQNAAWGTFENQNEPIFQQQSSQLNTQLANQGLHPGDAAYDTALANLQRNQDTARQSASYGSVLTGLQGAGEMQGMDVAAQQAQTAALEGPQSYDVNLLNSLTTGQQVQNPQFPTYSGASSGQPANLLGAAQATGNSLLDQYNAQQSSQNSLYSGLGSAASSYLMYLAATA